MQMGSIHLVKPQYSNVVFKSDGLISSFNDRNIYMLLSNPQFNWSSVSIADQFLDTPPPILKYSDN